MSALHARSKGEPQARAAWRSVLWRVHFWAAVIATPFALPAALTGILYAFTPQIERVLHGHLDRVVAVGSPRTLDEVVAAASKAAPQGWRVAALLPPHSSEDSVRVAFLPPRPAPTGHEHHATAPARAFLPSVFGLPARADVVYVNPYDLDVLGMLPEADRFNNWSRKLHSSYLRDGWRWCIELGASWLLVMLLTGLLLWRIDVDRLVAGRDARSNWRRGHVATGVTLALVTAGMLITGLTWSEHAGNRVRQLRDAAGQASPRIPGSLRSAPGTSPQLSWQQALEAIRREAPDTAMVIVPPEGEGGVWRASNFDRAGDPAGRFDLVLDATSGHPLYFSGWERETAFGKATAIGIPFHRGEFGVWNQVVLLAFGGGVLASLVTGWRMFMLRGRRGNALPPVTKGAWRQVPPFGWLLALAMMAMLPLLAISALAVMALEAGLFLRRHRGTWSIGRSTT